jgi:hypothetical protein
MRWRCMDCSVTPSRACWLHAVRLACAVTRPAALVVIALPLLSVAVRTAFTGLRTCPNTVIGHQCVCLDAVSRPRRKSSFVRWDGVGTLGCSGCSGCCTTARSPRARYARRPSTRSARQARSLWPQARRPLLRCSTAQTKPDSQAAHTPTHTRAHTRTRTHTHSPPRQPWRPSPACTRMANPTASNPIERRPLPARMAAHSQRAQALPLPAACIPRGDCRSQSTASRRRSHTTCRAPARPSATTRAGRASRTSRSPPCAFLRLVATTRYVVRRSARSTTCCVPLRCQQHYGSRLRVACCALHRLRVACCALHRLRVACCALHRLRVACCRVRSAGVAVRCHGRQGPL